MKKIEVLIFILLGIIIYTSADAQTKKEKIDLLICAYTDADCFNIVVLVSEKVDTEQVSEKFIEAPRLK